MVFPTVYPLLIVCCSVQNRVGVTPLTLACRLGLKNVAEILLDAGADINKETTRAWCVSHRTRLVLCSCVVAGVVALVIVFIIIVAGVVVVIAAIVAAGHR